MGNYSTNMGNLHLKAIRSILDKEDPNYKIKNMTVHVSNQILKRMDGL